MIPFHKIYAWLFKSFLVGQEARLVNKLTDQWYDKMMIVKRSWIFILYQLWIPFILLVLSIGSILLAIYQIPDQAAGLKTIIIVGNILMTIILLISTFVYIIHFREVYSDTDKIIVDIPAYLPKLQAGDKYFTTFFNWSITNQWLLILIMILEIIFIITNLKHLNEHLFLLAIDFIIIIVEIHYLRKFRKRMMDLEMDFNIIVQGKIFFVNQTGLLSDTQTIESDKIKTVKSSFPGKWASFFNYGDIDILTEWDSSMIGAMKMNYVTSPTNVVNSIQMLLGEIRSIPPKYRNGEEPLPPGEIIKKIDNEEEKKNNEGHSFRKPVAHSVLQTEDTSEKVRDILE